MSMASSGRRRIAVIGGGIAGNTAAWALSRRHDVTVYEADARSGGHARTVDILVDGRTIAVDVGFIVYNVLNYPNLIRLFEHLGIATRLSDMSFAVSLGGGALEYASEANFTGLFAQTRNLLRPDFLRMALDIPRIYKAAGALDAASLEGLTLGGLLDRLGVSRRFAEWHIIPMTACIWSASFEEALAFPAATFVNFFRNHGLFRLADRPDWRTVAGGSRRYVDALVADTPGRRHLGAAVTSVARQAGGVCVRAQGLPDASFDQLVFACHADQALALIEAPTAAEAAVLGGFRTSRNEAVLHCDPRVMPRRRRVWSSWNYVEQPDAPRDAPTPITYWMNRLQQLPTTTPVLVSLNPRVAIDSARVFERFVFRHPVYDAAAIAAQRRLPEIQGADRLWFCGAWTGYGFHEDGCASGLAVGRALGCQAPWDVESLRPAA